MTASETKAFGVADILTHTTGRLLTPIGDVYLFLEWVTGEQGVMTHQLPRLSREVTPFLEKTFPDLAAIDIADVPISSQADVDALMTRLAVAHGTYRDVPRMPVIDHTHIDPLAELKMLKPDAEVIVVQVPDEGASWACVQDPALFASTDVLDHTLAARLCDVCPVRVSCREATEETAKHRPDLLHGTYAGRRFGGS